MAASLVLLHEARNGRAAPGLARVMLWLGIAATVGANVAFGARFGLLGAVISAWPAVSFIGAVEMAMQLVRRARGPQRAADAPTGTAGLAWAGLPVVPGDVREAVVAAYAASVAAGAPLSQRAMAARFGISRRQVSQLITQASGRNAGRGGGGRVNRYRAIGPAALGTLAARAVRGDRATRTAFFAALGEEAARSGR